MGKGRKKKSVTAAVQNEKPLAEESTLIEKEKSNDTSLEEDIKSKENLTDVMTKCEVVTTKLSPNANIFVAKTEVEDNSLMCANQQEDFRCTQTVNVNWLQQSWKKKLRMSSYQLTGAPIHYSPPIPLFSHPPPPLPFSSPPPQHHPASLPHYPGWGSHYSSTSIFSPHIPPPQVQYVPMYFYYPVPLQPDAKFTPEGKETWFTPSEGADSGFLTELEESDTQSLDSRMSADYRASPIANGKMLAGDLDSHHMMENEKYSNYKMYATDDEVIGRRDPHNREDNFEIKFGEVAEVLEGLKLHT